MRRQLRAQQGQQGWVAESVQIGNAQHDERLADQLLRELLAQPVGVAALHHQHGAGPAQQARRHAPPRPGLGAGRAGLVMRVVIKQQFGRGAALLVLAAKEEQVAGVGGYGGHSSNEESRAQTCRQTGPPFGAASESKYEAHRTSVTFTFLPFTRALRMFCNTLCTCASGTATKL